MFIFKGGGGGKVKGGGGGGGGIRSYEGRDTIGGGGGRIRIYFDPLLPRLPRPLECLPLEK